MKKYTVKHLITSALLSLTALVVGYALLSLPFRLMDWLDPTQMKLVFAAEFVLYITAPFNLLKWVIISVLTALIYKPLSPLLHSAQKR